MLLFFDKVRNLEQFLYSQKKGRKIVDYRLRLKVNMSVSLYVITDNVSYAEIESEVKKLGIWDSIDIEKISKDDSEIDEYYSSVFKTVKSFDMGLRRRLDNLIEDNDEDIENPNNPCPIVCFYSYKGGVGRTTALALFASHYAVHHGKKVFIMDCDFDAPGLINFYDIRNEDVYKNGVIEYVWDKKNVSDIEINDYIYEVSRNYSENGNIWLMPAGNIFEAEDRSDYLESLARLDIHSTTTIVEQFREVVSDIYDKYHPDVILIDSRTGYNDVFGMIANKLSNVIVGFFGNNTQTKPGLHFFLDTLLKQKKKQELILVRSIISDSPKQEKDKFAEEVNSYIAAMEIGDLLLPVLPILSLPRQIELEKIGTSDEDADFFGDIIKRKRFPDYEDLFEKITENIENNSEHERTLSCESDKLKDKNSYKTDETCEERNNLSDLKKVILDNLRDDKKFPEPYAEDIQLDDNFLKSKFYIRTCMKDIFNNDKFLLIGGKGTGKTAFYKALGNDNFFSSLRKIADKENINYHLISLISLDPARYDKNKIIDVFANFPVSEISDPEHFFRKFWIVYIWNSIRLNDSETGFNSVSGLEVNSISDSPGSADYLKKYINDKGLFDKIIKDLELFDLFLKQKNYYAMIIFDQLDKIIKPKYWDKAVAPLINYCQSCNFKRILPKLFLRRDLFNKIGNLTNKNQLTSRTIKLEWTQEELYAFFFKVVFAYSEKEFFNYMKSVKVNSDKIQEIKKITDSYNQIPPDENYVKPLIETFFGNYAVFKEKNYGEMYEWLFRNLRNADYTISLRPFLDLIKYAIEEQYQQSFSDKDYPILPFRCFTPVVRVRCVERYFEDLSKEAGNEILETIIKDIKDTKTPRELKITPLQDDEFEELMKNIIDRHKTEHDNPLKDVTISQIEEIFKFNGIIFVRYNSRGIKRYSFAYLYKYYLGLIHPLKRHKINGYSSSTMKYNDSI